MHEFVLGIRRYLITVERRNGRRNEPNLLDFAVRMLAVVIVTIFLYPFFNHEKSTVNCLAWHDVKTDAETCRGL